MLANVLKGSLQQRPEVEYITNVSSTSNLTTYTFNSTSIGSAATDRYVVIGASGSSGTTSGISSITVNGNNATELVQVSGSTVAAGLFIAAVPTGTTANIVVTFGGGKERCDVGVWKVTKLNSATPYDTASLGSGLSVNTGSVNIDTRVGGILLSYVHRGGVNSGTTTWTGATENYDTTLESRIISGASLNNTPTETNRLIQTDFTSSATGLALVAVSF
jgi:hypothetical protein